MSLDMHAAATSIVAAAHLAAGAGKSAEARSAATAAVREAMRPKDGRDSVELTGFLGMPRLPGGFPDIQRALLASGTAAEEILKNPTPALNAQANSTPEQVIALMV